MLDVTATLRPAKHQPQSAPNSLLRQDISFGRVGAETENDGIALHVPTFYPCRQIRSVSCARDLGSLFCHAFGNPLQRPLHHIVDDGLLKRIVVNRPRKKLALGVTGRCSEIQLCGQSVWYLRVKFTDQFVPFTFLIMCVMRFIVEHNSRTALLGDSLVEIYNRHHFGWRFWA